MVEDKSTDVCCPERSQQKFVAENGAKRDGRYKRFANKNRDSFVL